MKKFKLTIEIQTSDKITPDDFQLIEDDVLDGYVITRDHRLGDPTHTFHIKSARIENISGVETDRKKILIHEIKRIIEDWGATTSCDLQLDSSPCLNSIGNGKNNVCELIEYFNHDGVGTVTYQDELELDENDYPYEDLSLDILEEIANIMEDYDVDMTKTMERCKD